MILPNIRSVLRIDARHTVLDTYNDELVMEVKQHGLIEALTLFNKYVADACEGQYWPVEWLQHRDVIDVVGSMDNDFNRGAFFLDFFLIFQSIKDPVMWKKKLEEQQNVLLNEIEALYKVANEEGDIILNRSPREDSVQRSKDWEFVHRLEYIAGRKAREDAENWSFVQKYFARRGRTEGQSARCGWAVHVLDLYINDKHPTKAATIAHLISDLGEVHITRQNVRGILKVGTT